jgi:hypothetical protein
VALVVLLTGSAASGAAHPVVHAVSEVTSPRASSSAWSCCSASGSTGRAPPAEQGHVVYFIHPLVVVALGYAFSWPGAVVKFVIVGAWPSP